MEKDTGIRIIDHAKELGASVAGIANVQALKRSPSHFVFEKLERYEGVGTQVSGKVKPGEVYWPEFAGSAVVIGIEHSQDKPELDWWQEGLQGGTAGNHLLMDINSRLSDWLEDKMGFKTLKLPYHVENGGIFLKDAAVMAGLGCIGKNNLFITPDYGPRVRLRAMLLDVEFPATGALDFDPCRGCAMPCRTACPQAAFQKQIYRRTELGLNALPGRSGVYSRQRCNIQMQVDLRNAENIRVNEQNTTGKLVKYCRLCEFSCPVGGA
ncbi:MAG: epoxyqueuosine reductase [Desulfobacterales bacterium]|jgi:epoxyqueuosine reductase